MRSDDGSMGHYSMVVYLTWQVRDIINGIRAWRWKLTAMGFFKIDRRLIFTVILFNVNQVGVVAQKLISKCKILGDGNHHVKHHFCVPTKTK